MKRRGCVIQGAGWFPCKACDIEYGGKTCKSVRDLRGGVAGRVECHDIQDETLRLAKKLPNTLPERYRRMRP